MALVRVAVALAPLARTIPAPVLLLAFRSTADVAVFSPIPRFFRASFGGLLYLLRNFRASASIPWLRLWCSLFCSVCLFSAYLYPTVASLGGFSCGPPSLVVPVCVCVCVWGFFLWRRSCVFFLSCWVWGKLLLSLYWCGCCAFSWGTCGFLRRVLQLVTLFGFRTYLAPVSWPTPAGGRLLLGWRCLGTPLGFLPCTSAASPSAAYP